MDNRRRCTAKAKSTGTRCKRRPIPGGTVCVKHGGGAPQVKAKAAERLAALVDPAIDRLGRLVRTKQERVALGAVKDVLDRNGYKPPDKHEHTGADGGPIQTQAVAPDLSKWSNADLARLAELRGVACQPRGGDGA